MPSPADWLSDRPTPPAPSGDGVVGYVLKMFPRLSETFIVNEIVARERAGERIEVASLRPPVDGRFHAKLASIQASVHWVPAETRSGQHLWERLAAAHAVLPELDRAVRELLAHDVRDALQAVEVACWVRMRGISHLHAHFATTATTVARLAARLAGVPYSFTAHAKDIYQESVDEAELRRALRDADHVVTVSDHNVEDLRRRFGDDAARVVRVYNGLDLGELRCEPRLDGPALIVAVGRLVEKKGFADLIDAVSVLRARGRAVPTVIVGAGRLEPALREQIDRSELTGTVELLGPRSQDDTHALIRAGTVFAAPVVVAPDGDRDGLPTVLLEAMALGTPVVATPVTGIPEAVVDGETGLLVPERDPYALGDALERLLDDGMLRSRLAGAARRMIEARFDVTAQAAALHRLRAGERVPAGAGAAAGS